MRYVVIFRDKDKPRWRIGLDETEHAEAAVATRNGLLKTGHEAVLVSLDGDDPKDVTR